jgi:hypothetical protein
MGDSTNTNADIDGRADAYRDAHHHRITVANRRHNGHAISHSFRLSDSNRYSNGYAAHRDSDGDANAFANRDRLSATNGDAHTVDDEHGVVAAGERNPYSLAITRRQPDADPDPAAVGDPHADAKRCSVFPRWRLQL